MPIIKRLPLRKHRVQVLHRVHVFDRQVFIIVAHVRLLPDRAVRANRRVLTFVSPPGLNVLRFNFVFLSYISLNA